MSDALLIKDFLQPISISYLLGDIALNESQWGSHISSYTDEFPDLRHTDIALIGIPDERGDGTNIIQGESPDCIRKQFYQLYNWHTDIRMADLGNVKAGQSLSDTYAATRTIIKALTEQNITVIILGGSHDLSLAQYGAYIERKKIIEASCIDAHINLVSDIGIKSENFLMEMLTGEPNYLKHYNHIAFQSYFVHPAMLQTMDKLRFDCFRLGAVKENIQEMEPVLRNSHMLTIDISAMAHAYAPGSAVSPNGLNGEEICTLTQYAGMSPELSSVGMYGYNSDEDYQQLTAKQIAQMIWYFIDGKVKGNNETKLTQRENFNEYHTVFNEIATVFLQSKKT